MGLSRSTITVVALAAACPHASAIVVGSHAPATARYASPAAATRGGALSMQSSREASSTVVSGRVVPTSQLSEQMRDMRSALEADEQASLMMQALRGTNINDDDAAADGTSMKVVEMRRGEGDDVLPLEYDPEALAA